jgi:ubiquinone/menaquinone biosynthesis C-methylase UbiE
MDGKPRLYGELASWFPVLTPPAEYAKESRFYRRALLEACEHEPRSLLELGSGGGHNASHLKQRFEMTLVDVSPEMLELSRALNPECEHIEGDMRAVRLGREFDAVFIHDAIVYMTSIDDLRKALETAFVHCRPGGAALFVPDHTRENFRPSTDHGGDDVGDKALRYLEWTWDPDPDDTTYVVDYAYLLRTSDGEVRVERDRHIEGLFSRADWLRLIEEVGFRPALLPLEHSELEPDECEVFAGSKPSS